MVLHQHLDRKALDLKNQRNRRHDGDALRKAQTDLTIVGGLLSIAPLRDLNFDIGLDT